MNWERARTEDQKQFRIHSIIEATANLFETMTYEDITFSKIAKEAKFTRSNLYKYFTTKEDIFLEFLNKDMYAWLTSIHEAYDMNHNYSLEAFAQIWTNVLKKHKRLLRLITISENFLEKKCSPEALLHYKKNIYQLSDELVAFLMKVLNTEEADKLNDFIVIQISLASGLYPMSEFSPRKKQILEDYQFEYTPTDFDSTFEKSIGFILKGLFPDK